MNSQDSNRPAVPLPDTATSKACDVVPNRSAPPAMHPLIAVVYLVAAGVCLVLGVLGFILPVLPGTPFVLLASVLLLKGSPRLHKRLRASRFFGRILRDWEERGGIRRKDRIRAILVVFAGATFSFFFGPQDTILRIVGLCFVLFGLFVIMRLPLARH